MDFSDDDEDFIGGSKRPLKKLNITWEHKWPPIETQKAVSESQFSKIPDETLIYILRFLSVRDLCHVSLVCRWFKMIADQDEIWKSKCPMSKRLYSKSYKYIFIDCIYQKNVRDAKTIIGINPLRRQFCRCTPPLYPLRPTTNSRFQPIGGFEAHPNSSADMTVELSVDIKETTPELMNLLEKASKFLQKLEDRNILKQMITRYYRFMQLKASLPPNIMLVPTLDIEIIWQTHLLRPEMYAADCLRLFRKIIDHSLLINDVEKHFKEQALHDTCKLYKARFNEHYCPQPSIENNQTDGYYYRDINGDEDRPSYDYSYWDKTKFEFFAYSPVDYENPFSFTESDILLDSDWLKKCEEFMINTLHNFGIATGDNHPFHLTNLNVGLIKRLMKSYERFLYIAAKYPLIDGNGFIPPTYAIDIMWRAHMQEPLNYIANCKRLVGYVVFHEPWARIDDKALEAMQRKLDDIWKSEFASEIKTDHLFNTIDQDSDW